MLVAATRQVHGPESMGIVAATGCNTVFGSTYPFNPYLVPWTNSLFENAPGRRARASGALGPGRPPGPAAVGHRRRRRDVRHRLPGAVADGRVGRGHQGPRARHAGLLEHRRPGVDGVVRRPGDQALGVRQGAPRSARAAQGARADPDGARRRCTSRRPRRRTSTTSTGRSWRRTPTRGRRWSSPTRRACPSTASRTTPRRASRKLAVESRAFPLFTYDPRRGEHDRRAAVAPGQPGAARGLGDAPRRDADRLPGVRAHGGPVRRRTSRRRVADAPRSSRRQPTPGRAATSGRCGSPRSHHPHRSVGRPGEGRQQAVDRGIVDPRRRIRGS